ncbi:Lipid A export ATP-binding/permease protein MsbA [Bienertia sinuspersici]
MDEESLKPGPKRYMQALVWIKPSKPLVPGCYIEYEPSNMLWVDFRYEGVFRFCNKCGRIGHTMSECNKSWEMAEQDFNGVIRAHSNAREIYSQSVCPTE